MKIRRLPSGNYNTVLYLGKDADGKQIRKSVTAPDKPTVRRLASEIEARHEKAPAPMLCDAIEAYIDARGAVLSPSAYWNVCPALTWLATRPLWRSSLSSIRRS